MEIRSYGPKAKWNLINRAICYFRGHVLLKSQTDCLYLDFDNEAVSATRYKCLRCGLRILIKYEMEIREGAEKRIEGKNIIVNDTQGIWPPQ